MTKKNKTKGTFITFEGGEGAGKSTLISYVKSYLEKAGQKVISTREPGGSTLGDQIRKWLLDQSSTAPLCSRAELMLFLAARAQHLEELVKPALDAGNIVLCDRFNDSTIAYQGIARGLGFEQVETLCNFVCAGTLPTLTFILDVDPIEGLRRTSRLEKENAVAGKLDRIESEKIEFHNLVRKGMHQLAALYPKRIHLVDAQNPQEEVFEEVTEILENHFALAPRENG